MRETPPGALFRHPAMASYSYRTAGPIGKGTESDYFTELQLPLVATVAAFCPGFSRIVESNSLKLVTGVHQHSNMNR